MEAHGIGPQVKKLIDKGVTVLNPSTVYVEDQVDTDRISPDGVLIHPGCRILGAATVISAGCELGKEAPITLDNCQLGERVQLKGGFFTKSVFLDRANMALGAHVREACLLEEEANGAHTVGLKQTILMPFVTLGSLINFCDCLMAGGTSRRNHSEVGSSYIHFNFTPEGDKTTASLIGDVPRGVMLNQAPIFLGGQGGMVGPVRVGYGNVLAAGTILRHDIPEDRYLVADGLSRSFKKPLVASQYLGLVRVVNNNAVYLGNLLALEEWYRHVRRPFFAAQPFGELVFEGALAVLALAKKERLKRLRALAEKMPEAIASAHRDGNEPEARRKRDLYQNIDALEAAFHSGFAGETALEKRDRFLAGLAGVRGRTAGGYVDVIQAQTPEVSVEGSLWLQAIVDAGQAALWRVLPLYGPDTK